MGHLDSPLSDLGKIQANAIACRLKRLSFSHLYSSDLGRAIETAEYISKETGHEVHKEPLLRETNLGIFQGLTRSEKKEKYPEEWFRYNSDQRYEFIIPKGESQRQRTERAVKAMNRFADHHSKETIVVVTHAGILKGFFEYVLGISVIGDNLFIRRNAAYNSFIKRGDQWLLEVWGDANHLENL